MSCWTSLLQRLRPTLENSALSPLKAEGQGCARTPREPRLRAQSARLSPLIFSFLRISLPLVSLFGNVCSPGLSSVSLCLFPSLHLFAFMAMPVSLCLLLSDSLRLRVCPGSLARTPSLFLAASQGQCPTLHAWISLPISLSSWGEEQEEQAEGRQQPRFHEEGEFKPERPGQTKARNFSLPRRAGYLV